MAIEYFVAPDGDDSNRGSLEKPFKSISRAQEAVRNDGALGKEPVTVHLRAGTHYLADAIRFTADDSGTSSAPVTYTARADEEVVVSGGAALDLQWESYKDGILQARTPAGLEIDQLFVNGERQHMARYPNYDEDVLPYNGYAADAFSPERAVRWQDPVGGYIHAMHKAHWGGYHYRITGKNSDGTVAYEGGWQNNRQMGMHDEHRFVENIFEELDAPGEWFHDQKAQTLYYYPPKDIDVSNATIEIARLKHLFEFNGLPEEPVQHVHLRGITFRHAVRTFMEPYEPLLRSDWTIYRGGTVRYTGAEDCSIADCEFDQVGGNAVFASGYNRRLAVRGTHIHGAGGNGVCFVGNSDSVRSPLFERCEHQAYDEIDKTPGPKSDSFPADCVVEDCLIHNISVVEKQAAGVQISMARGITVRHCSIYDVGRAGINISEGTFGGHLIEFCDIFDTVRETSDHGSFNSWGRDRYWELEGAPDEELADLMLLDAGKTIIRNSRWRCDHGWDVDLDDGSSNYEIYNNLFLRGGLKLREGFLRKAYNNIGFNCTLHPHVWYANSRDVVTNNIWMGPYRPAGMKNWDGEIDQNMFVSERDKMAFADKGCDSNSIVGDPMFVDPANGDYTVGPESPFLEFGFENFPMDKFGVQKPSLKSVARTPIFPDLVAENPDAGPQQATSEIWMGAEVSALTGEQFSAFGVRREDGGVHLVSVPSDSAAAKIGLKEGDLIQQVGWSPVRTIAELRQHAGDPPKEKNRLRVVRKQQQLSIDTI